MIRDEFGHIIRKLIKWMKKGIMARGNEPALTGGQVVCTGNMSFILKVPDRGGGCKIRENFCGWCECNGEHNMWHLYFGEGRCKYYKYNGRYACIHEQVNTLDDVKVRANSS